MSPRSSVVARTGPFRRTPFPQDLVVDMPCGCSDATVRDPGMLAVFGNAGIEHRLFLHAGRVGTWSRMAGSSAAGCSSSTPSPFWPKPP